MSSGFVCTLLTVVFVALLIGAIVQGRRRLTNLNQQETLVSSLSAHALLRIVEPAMKGRIGFAQVSTGSNFLERTFVQTDKGQHFESVLRAEVEYLDPEDETSTETVLHVWVRKLAYPTYLGIPHFGLNYLSVMRARKRILRAVQEADPSVKILFDVPVPS